MTDERKYASGELKSTELQAELVKFFESAGDDPAVRRDAEEAKVNLDELLAGGPAQIEVKGVEPQMTGAEVAIILFLLKPPVQSAWDEVVMPWLRRRHNSPLGERERAED
jgi:hypothetical protein